jgi:hypothetical protein
MAEVTVENARPCTPAGYEVVDRCVLAEDVAAGDLLVYTGNVVDGLPEMEKAPSSAKEVHGIALKDGYSGQSGFDVGVQGEMDGFAGLTPGTPLFASSTSGKIDTTEPTDAALQLRAVRSGRVRYTFV